MQVVRDSSPLLLQNLGSMCNTNLPSTLYTFVTSFVAKEGTKVTYASYKLTNE